MIVIVGCLGFLETVVEEREEKQRKIVDCWRRDKREGKKSYLVIEFNQSIWTEIGAVCVSLLS